MLTKARKPAISHSATHPILSDRTLYPYFWRTIIPDTPLLMGMPPLALELGFTEVALVVAPVMSGLTESSIDAIKAAGLKTVGPNLGVASGYDWDVNGFWLAEDTYEEALYVVKMFKRTPARYMIANLYASHMRLIGCAMYHENVRGTILVHLGWFSVSWFVPTEDEVNAGFPCTTEQMKVVAEGSLSLNVQFHRPDQVPSHGCVPGTNPLELIKQYAWLFI